MSVDDVLGVLRQHGEFEVNKVEWPSLVQLRINFVDLQGEVLYGDFILEFFDDKYRLASTSGNLDFGRRRETICSILDQVTPSGTEIPAQP